jgi:hypothetical protein
METSGQLYALVTLPSGGGGENPLHPLNRRRGGDQILYALEKREIFAPSGNRTMISLSSGP